MSNRLGRIGITYALKLSNSTFLTLDCQFFLYEGIVCLFYDTLHGEAIHTTARTNTHKLMGNSGECEMHWI
jgi:hypothetical protein